MSTKQNAYLIQLRDQIVKAFDMEELEELVFDLNVDWDEIRGSRKTARVQDLITQLARNGRLEELAELLKKSRPSAEWPHIPSTEQQKQDIRTAFPKKPLHQQSWVWASAIALLVVIGISLTTWVGGQTSNQIDQSAATIIAANPTNTAIPTPTLTPIPSATPLPFLPATADETLIVIATFYRAEGLLQNAEVHNEIRRAIQANINELGLENDVQVKVEPSTLRTENRDEAEALGKQYNATLIIWGEETSARIEVSFLNLKEPDFDAAEATISETENTQIASIANPEAYSAFVLEQLPGQLSFLSFFALGQTAYSQENFEEAIVLIETAVNSLTDQQETDANLELQDAHFRLGWLYQNNGHPTYTDDGVSELVVDSNLLHQAVANYDQAIALFPNFADAFNNRGVAYQFLGNLDQAIADFDQGITLNPESSSLFFNRAYAFTGQGVYEQAIADYEQAIELDPEFVEAYNNLALLHLITKEDAQALVYLEQGLLLEPGNHYIRTNRQNIYDHMQDHEKYLADLDQIIDLNPERVSAYFVRGRVYYLLQEYVQSINNFDQVIALNPEYAEAYDYRGTAYRYLGEYEKAFADYKQYVDLNPSFPFPSQWNRVCWYGSLLGYAEDVSEACEKAVSLAQSDGSKASYQDSRGLNQALINESEAAIADFQAFVDYYQERPGYESLVEKRISWITLLKANENPFDIETLKELLNE